MSRSAYYLFVIGFLASLILAAVFSSQNGRGAPNERVFIGFFAACFFISNCVALVVRAATTDGPPQRLLPLAVLALGFSVACPYGAEMGAGAFWFIAGLFSALSLCAYLGRVVAVEERRDLGMFLGLVFGPLGVLIAAVLKRS